VNSSMMYLIHYKNICKCHNAPPPSTTIKSITMEHNGISNLVDESCDMVCHSLSHLFSDSNGPASQMLLFVTSSFCHKHSCMFDILRFCKWFLFFKTPYMSLNWEVNQCLLQFWIHTLLCSYGNLGMVYFNATQKSHSMANLANMFPAYHCSHDILTAECFKGIFLHGFPNLLSILPGPKPSLDHCVVKNLKRDMCSDVFM
jgi:hypothetical protein